MVSGVGALGLSLSYLELVERNRHDLGVALIRDVLGEADHLAHLHLLRGTLLRLGQGLSHLTQIDRAVAVLVCDASGGREVSHGQVASSASIGRSAQPMAYACAYQSI